MSVKDKMTAIADAIRSKRGGNSPLTLDDMASGVNDVYAIGHSNGGEAEYDTFWDAFQDNGSRWNYEMAFAGHNWKPEIFRPKYPIKPTNARQMFYKASYLICDIASVSSIDFSNNSDFTQTFQNFQGTRIGIVDLRKATKLDNAFANCYELITIDKIIVDESLPATLNFANDEKLENVTIEGELVKNVYAGVCPFAVESLKSIITALKDNSETADEYKYTVTFLASAFEALEAEGDTAEYNGVACTWAELIDNKKWNLVKA